MPKASYTVGTMSETWAYWWRISPLALMPAGQWTTIGSDEPPSQVWRLNILLGVLNANAQPIE